MSRNNAKPPWLPVRLVGWLADNSFRDELLDDLQEQWRQRTERSSRAADRWYWRECLRSMPALVGYRVSKTSAVKVGALIATNAFCILALYVWDVQVSRSIVGALASQPTPPSLMLLRVLYFLLFALGAAVAVIVTAPLVFEKHWSFPKNFSLAVAPVLITVNVPIIVDIISAESSERLLYRLFRSSMLVLIMVSMSLMVYRLGLYRAAFADKR